MTNVMSGEVPESAIAELGLALKLPATLRGYARLGTGVAAGLGVAGLLPVVGPSAAIAGAVVTLATSIWSGMVPEGFSRSLLKPILKWEFGPGQPGSTKFNVIE
jgi:hypothetical protein